MCVNDEHGAPICDANGVPFGGFAPSTKLLELQALTLRCTPYYPSPYILLHDLTPAYTHLIPLTSPYFHYVTLYPLTTPYTPVTPFHQASLYGAQKLVVAAPKEDKPARK